MFSLTENFWVACAEALKVSALWAGLVGTLPNLFASSAQIAMETLASGASGRLATIRRLVAIQWLALLPLTLLPVIPERFRYSLLIGCAVLFAIGKALPDPVWVSLMSDHLPHRSKNRYFGWRNGTLGLIGLSGGLAAGQFLNAFDRKHVIAGFAVLFGIAAVLRLVSWILMGRMYEPRPRSVRPGSAQGEPLPGSFFEFVSSGHPFARFALFVGFFHFAVNLTGPYLPVYLLRDLRLSYATFTYVVLSASLTSMLGFRLWGTMADRYGNLKVIRATALFISIIPIFWFLLSEPIGLALLQNAGGFAWAGFQLGIMTFALSEVPPAFRTRALAWLAAVNGLAIFAGCWTGGMLLKVLPVWNGSAFRPLFLLSWILRSCTLLVFLKQLKELRPAQPISTLELYAGVLGLQPVLRSGKSWLEAAWPGGKGS
jgi:MFS family permease